MTTFLVAVGMAIGLLGTFLPVVPGLTLIWLSGLVYGFVEGWSAVGIACFVVMTVLAVAGFLAALALPANRATSAGAGRWSVVLGAVLAVIGVFALPPVGFAIFGIAGLYVGERVAGRSHDAASDATIATIKGLGWAFVAQFAAGAAMVVAWLVWVAFG